MAKAARVAGSVVVLPHEVGIPAAPPAELDPYLDAAGAVFAKYGITRSSVQDIARRMGVNRATVYRQVGNIESAARLLLAREINRAMSSLPPLPAGASGADYVIEMVAGLVTFARSQPVAMKVLHDEPELIGPFLATDMGALIGRVSESVRPLLEAAMGAGLIATRDAGALAEWITRIGLSVIIAPPAGELRDFLSVVLRPALVPTKAARS
jgi:AcrR family transcriptional regulator